MTSGEGSPRIVVAGGGTTGHLSPGLAVADVLRDRGCEVLFIGTTKGPESRLVPNAGFEFSPIPVVGRGRGSLTPRNLKAALTFLRGWWRSTRILKSFRPHAVLGTGGYVSLPVTLAARSKGIPVIVHEQNVGLGMANRLAARFASTVCVSFPPQGPTTAKIVFTGNPVRREISGIDAKDARPAAGGYFDLQPDRRTVLVFGGSQGAMKINAAAIAAHARLRHREDLQFLHVTGSENLSYVQELLDRGSSPSDRIIWRTVGYTDRMELAYAIADVVVCRAGASSIAELASVGLPAVLVPLPGSLENDQRRNAEFVVARGAGTMVLDQELDADSLIAAIERLLGDPAALTRMSLQIKGLSKPDAAEDVANCVLAAARAA